MNRKLLCTLPIGLLVAGCAAYVPPGAPGCEAYSEPLTDCKGKPNAPHVTLNTNKMSAAPACIRVYPGKTIVFQLKPPPVNEPGSVEISPKNPANKWLAGTNKSNKDYIIIEVPKDIEFPKDKKKIDFDYAIKTPNRCVDPRVSVEKPGGPG